MTERLYRSGRDKMIGGVCGGFADYFNVDVTLIRLVALVSLFMGGVGFFAYIVALIIIPLNPADKDGHLNQRRDFGHVVKEVDFGDLGQEVVTNLEDTPRGFNNHENHEKRSKMAGGILVTIGVLFLVERYFPAWFNMSQMWPLILIVIGIAVIFRGGRK